MPKQYGYHWIDLDEYYQSVNGLNSIGGIPEELKAIILRGFPDSNSIEKNQVVVYRQ
jgi:hypothetical protein